MTIFYKLHQRLNRLLSPQPSPALSPQPAPALIKDYYNPDFFGNKMFSNPGDLGIDLGMLKGIPLGQFKDKGEIGYLLHNLRSGQTVLDIGANIGYFTVLFSRAVGESGKVLSFEPGPLSFALLQANIRVNCLSQSLAFNTAVGDKNGTIDLFLCRTGESDNRIEGTLSDHADRDRIEVPIVVIDDFLAEREIAKIDYVKIDVQGAEWSVLSGMRRTIQKNPDIHIILEYAPGGIRATGKEPIEFLTFIRSLGLAIFALPEDGPSVEVDDEYLLINIGGPSRTQTNLVLRHIVSKD